MQNHQLIPAGTRLQLLDLLHRQNGLTNSRGNVAMKLCIGEYVQVITHDVLTMELCNSLKYFFLIPNIIIILAGLKIVIKSVLFLVRNSRGCPKALDSYIIWNRRFIAANKGMGQLQVLLNFRNWSTC